MCYLVVILITHVSDKYIDKPVYVPVLKHCCCKRDIKSKNVKKVVVRAGIEPRMVN